MDEIEVMRLAKQLVYTEKLPDEHELVKKHLAEWARLPWEARVAIVKKSEQLER